MLHQHDIIASGSGGPGGYHGCSEGVPVELGLLTLLAAFGVAFGVLYRALTLKTGRRRKRSKEDGFFELEFGENDESCENSESTEELIGCKVDRLLGRDGATGLSRFAELLWHGEST